jgi:hypothetical protein
METSKMRELLREARSMETSDCLTPNEAERVIRGIVSDEVKLHLEQRHLCKALIVAVRG